MALKKKISATAYEALSDELKAQYSLQGEDYLLDVEGDDRPTQEDVENLKRAKDHEKAARQKLEKELKDMKAAGEGGTQEAETLKGEIAALSERLNARDSALKKSALEVASSGVTAKSKFPNVMKPHVLARMQADINEAGDAVVSILGADGKPSKMTVEELADEFTKNKEFEGLMLGSQASGGGGGKPPADGAKKPLKEMTEAERVAMAKDDPEGFRQLQEAATTAV